MKKIYYIEHTPTRLRYTIDQGTFRPGRNWRRHSYTSWVNDRESACLALVKLLADHATGVRALRIRYWGGYDCEPYRAIGNGAIIAKDFVVIEEEI